MLFFFFSSFFYTLPIRAQQACSLPELAMEVDTFWRHQDKQILKKEKKKKKKKKKKSSVLLPSAAWISRCCNPQNHNAHFCVSWSLLLKLRAVWMWDTRMEMDIKSDMQPVSIDAKSVWIFGKIIIVTVMGAYSCFHIAFEVGCLSFFFFSLRASLF